MQKTYSVIAVSLASLAFAAIAGAAETKTEVDARAAAKQVATAAKAASAAPITLSQIFAEVADNLEVMSGPNGFVINTVTVPEVVVVRRDANGNRSAACVNSESAARAFLAGGGKQTKNTSTEKE
jgi:hypothetical protein